nr:FAD-dependent oxidoreductase [Psychrobacter sp. PraFG1]UNK04626.1 FAD-dependent oxidoreductase [Psychrobacter sp. PraFG1]
MTVIHVDDYVLNRQLDLPAALMLQEELVRRGVGLEVSAASTTIEVNDADEVVGLSLKDGRTLAADFIVMAVGIIPNTQLAADSGIEVNRAIVVDENMHTCCPNIYAIGECVEINDELLAWYRLSINT